MSVKRENIRFIEVTTGFFLIMSVLSILVAFLISFDYTLPKSSFEDDMDFLTDSITSQKISAIAWIVAGSVNLFLLPFYLILFQRFQKGMHIFNGLIILAMAYSFFRLGITELSIASLSILPAVNTLSMESIENTEFLLSIRQSIILLKCGISLFGGFATVFTISRFSEVKFPVFGSILAFLAGPVIITFTWLNPDHILMTSALALCIIGLLMIGGRLVNKGLHAKTINIES